MLTGESVPVSKTPGCEVYTATVNAEGSLKAEAVRVGGDTMLHQIVSMIEGARGTKAPIARKADRAAAVFIPAVILTAVACCILWLIAGKELSFSLTVMVSVLIIACPCALGLATPLAIIVGTGTAARYGILYKTAQILEGSGSVDTVVLDKTGTVTLGRPEVTDVICAEGFTEERVLELAASAEAESQHPVAAAVVRRAEGLSVPGRTDFRSVSGEGVVCSIGGTETAVGNRKLMDTVGADISGLDEVYERLSAAGKTCMFVSYGGGAVGVIAVADPVRPESAEAVSSLSQMGISTVMITGDNIHVASRVAGEIGITEYRADARPQDKLEAVKDLQVLQRNVAMVGDGINDSPALAQANVGIAVAGGTDIAVGAADIVLMNDDIRTVPAALEIGRATVKGIRQNLFLAFVYNAVCIPVAAGLPYLLGMAEFTHMPMLAAAAMACSSLSVTANALRLRRFRPSSAPAT